MTTTPIASKRRSGRCGRWEPLVDASHCARHCPEPAPLLWPDRIERPGRPLARPGHARLHLAEDEAAVVGRDDVELPEAGAVVPREHDVAGTLEVLRGETLAELPEGATRVGGGGHGATVRRAVLRLKTAVQRLRDGIATSS